MRCPPSVSGPAVAALSAVFIAMIVTMSASAQRAAVHFHVVDLDSGVPIARARIASPSAGTFPVVFTDVHGDVDAQLPGGVGEIRISKAGYVPQILGAAERADTGNIKLARGAAISGRVVDALGAPVVGQAVIVVRADDREERRYTAITNDVGDYRVGSLPDGRFTVSLGPAGMQVQAAPASVPADALSHLVIARRGDEINGIDFTVAARSTCPARVDRSTQVQSAPNRFSALPAGTISGRVATIRGLPVSCVEVVAFRGADRVATAMTDTDGRYVLEQLRGGSTYLIEFKRNGYVTLQWGQQQAGQPARPIVLRDRENVKNIDITLPRGGAITGLLFDEFGEPAENVAIRALELRGEDDRPIAVGAASATTDDRGRYRLFGLLPARYIVATVAANEPPDPRTGKGYAPAYYPGAVELASARPIDVQEEQERQWVDFAREPVRVVTVSGFALNSRNEPVTDRVILVASQRSGAVIAETQGAEVKGADGAFTIPNVPPGDYVLQATSKREGASPEFGMQYVTVYQEDPPPARIKTMPGLDIQGRLFEDGLPPVDPRRFVVTAVPVDWDQTSLLAGAQILSAADDGTVLLPGVHGPRRLVLTSSPSDWYLKSIRLRGRDITDEVTGGPLAGFGFVRDLEVIVSNKGATIEGEVMDGSTPATAASVVLFSSNPNHWFRNSRFVKATRGDSKGRFRIGAVADGDYFIAAIDPLDGSAANAWQSRDFLQTLIVNARRVRLRGGDDRNLSLPLVHR